MRRKTWTVGMLIPLVVAGVGVTTAPTAAAVETPGSCTGRKFDFRRSEVLLLAGRTLDDSRLRIALRVAKTQRAGQAWRVSITQNDVVIRAEDTFSTFSFSPFPFGGAEVNVIEVVANLPGLDRFRAVATNLRTGETCTAEAQEDVRVPDPL